VPSKSLDIRTQLRAAAIIRTGRRVLLHRFKEDKYWSLPGGRIEAGEDAKTALTREFVEELDQEIECKRLVWVIENFFSVRAQSYHELGLYFEARFRKKPRGESFCGREGDRPLEFRWFDPNELSGLDVRPLFVATELTRDRLVFRYLIHRDPPRAAKRGGRRGTR
jgi:8-oxo-dGTP pyrophosphatase MutT (NUDIX family)